MSEWYMTPRGTKLPMDLVKDLRRSALTAGMTKFTDDWLFTQVRLMPLAVDPVKEFIAYPKHDGGWGGWLTPCHAGEGIAYEFDADDNPLSWGYPIKRNGEAASEGSPEWVKAEQHVAAAWAFYRALNREACSNCRGNRNSAEKSGFWADTGNEKFGLFSNSFGRSQLHYECPVCSEYRATIETHGAGHGSFVPPTRVVETSAAFEERFR